jgi:hypothetical protein
MRASFLPEIYLSIYLSERRVGAVIERAQAHMRDPLCGGESRP